MSLQDKLDAMRQNFESGGPLNNFPGQIIETMHRATAELVASGVAKRGHKVGGKAASFVLNDPDGKAVSLAELLSDGPLVLTFYRGVWCPYCNADLQALQAALPKLETYGVKLVAISPQTAPNSRRSQRDNKLTFPILSDPGNEVAAAFGLRFKLPDYLADLYKNVFKNDLAVVNGDQSWTLPMPMRFVVALDGTILYAEVNPDYTRRPDPEELMPALQKLKAAGLTGNFRAASSAFPPRFAGEGTPARLPPILDPRRLELGAWQCAGAQHFDRRAHLAARADFFDHGGGNRFAGLVLDPNRHHVETIGIGHKHNLELVANSLDRAHRVCWILPGKHLYAAQIDQVVGASGEGADRPHVVPSAWTSRAIEGRVIADQKTQLRRQLGIEIRADGQSALAIALRLTRLGMDCFPDLDNPPGGAC